METDSGWNISWNVLWKMDANCKRVSIAKRKQWPKSTPKPLIFYQAIRKTSILPRSRREKIAFTSLHCQCDVIATASYNNWYHGQSREQKAYYRRGKRIRYKLYTEQLCKLLRSLFIHCEETNDGCNVMLDKILWHTYIHTHTQAKLIRSIGKSNNIM